MPIVRETRHADVAKKFAKVLGLVLVLCVGGPFLSRKERSIPPGTVVSCKPYWSHGWHAEIRLSNDMEIDLTTEEVPTSKACLPLGTRIEKRPGEVDYRVNGRVYPWFDKDASLGAVAVGLLLFILGIAIPARYQRKALQLLTTRPPPGAREARSRAARQATDDPALSWLPGPGRVLLKSSVLAALAEATVAYGVILALLHLLIADWALTWQPTLIVVGVVFPALFLVRRPSGKLRAALARRLLHRRLRRLSAQGRAFRVAGRIRTHDASVPAVYLRIAAALETPFGRTLRLVHDEACAFEIESEDGVVEIPASDVTLLCASPPLHKVTGESLARLLSLAVACDLLAPEAKLKSGRAAEVLLTPGDTVEVYAVHKEITTPSEDEALYRAGGTRFALAASPDNPLIIVPMRTPRTRPPGKRARARS